MLIGSTGRFGSEFIRLYSDRYRIIGIARRQPAELPSSYEFIVGDMCGNIDALVDTVLARTGRIDVLINSAVFSRWRSLVTADTSTFLAELEANVVAPFTAANAVMQKFWRLQPAAENMAERRNVIHMSSTAAIRVYAGSGQGTYATSKAALNTLTQHMAAEYWPYGVRVNALAPNAFPSHVGTELVAQAAVHLDDNDLNGKIHVLENNQQHYLL